MSGLRRYSLVIPQELYDELSSHGNTFVSVARQAFKLYLLVKKGELILTTKEGRAVEMID